MKKKVAYLGVLTALALILSYVESLIPIRFGIQGMKLGLANLVIVIALYRIDIRDTYLVSVARSILAGFIFGNMFSILYSLAGGLLSLSVMWGLKRTEKFSVIGVSMAGGVSFNVGQLLIAIIVLESLSTGCYFPVLLISGLVAGALIGLLSNELLKRLDKL